MRREHIAKESRHVPLDGYEWAAMGSSEVWAAWTEFQTSQVEPQSRLITGFP